jgi:purine-nucleoside phosphorylase
MTPAVVEQAVAYLKRTLPSGFVPGTAVVLGSGFGGLAESARIQTRLSYGQIPGMLPSSVAGHKGELLAGTLGSKPVLIFSGRNHYYEGHSLAQAALPARLAAGLGVRTLVLTAAVGGIRRSLRTGDLVVLSDHLNFMGDNPLRGAHSEAWGPRFPDLSDCYDAGLRKRALALAKKRKVRAFPGVYVAVSGPSYETPAEIRAFGRLGGDVVGMSTVPEAVAARQMGLKVLALCHVSNAAAGVSKAKLDHGDVLAAGRASAERLSAYLSELVSGL